MALIVDYSLFHTSYGIWMYTQVHTNIYMFTYLGTPVGGQAIMQLPNYGKGCMFFKLCMYIRKIEMCVIIEYQHKIM